MRQVAKSSFNTKPLMPKKQIGLFQAHDRRVVPAKSQQAVKDELWRIQKTASSATAWTSSQNLCTVL